MPLPDHNQLPDVVVDFQTGELLHTGVVHQWVKAMAEFYLDFDHADPPTDNQVWAKDPTSGLYVGTDMGGGGGPHTHPITDLEILGALLGDVVKFDGVVADWSPDLVGGGGSQYEFSTELYLRSDVPSGVGNGNSGLSWLNAKRTIAGANAAAPSTGAIIKFAPQRHDLDSWPVVFGQKRLSFEGPEGPSARWQSGNERAVIGAASGSFARYMDLGASGAGGSTYGARWLHLDFDPRGLSASAECVRWNNVNWGKMVDCRGFDPTNNPTAHINKRLLRGITDTDLSWCFFDENQTRNMKLLTVDLANESSNSWRIWRNDGGSAADAGQDVMTGPYIELLLGSNVTGQTSRGHGFFVMHNKVEQVVSGPLYRIKGGRPLYFAFNHGERGAGVFLELDATRNALVVSGAAQSGRIEYRSNGAQSFVTVPPGIVRDTTNNNLFINNHYPILDAVQGGAPNFVNAF